MRRPLVWALACAGVLASAPAARAGAELDAYRTFARSGEGAQLLAIARAAMRHDTAAADSTAPAWPGPPCGVYLSLVRGATTRACVGSDAPLRGSLVETVQTLAGEALTADRRRPPVRAAELDSLTIVIAFAGRAEPIADPMLVNPARDGLRVSSGRGSIAFVPGEARTVSWALREARRAGVLEGPVANASYARFDAVVIRESASGAR